MADRSGRIGKAVELQVAAMVILGTRGKVNASTAVIDDEGVDLTFFNAAGSIDVQVKARTMDAKISQRGTFLAGVREATFRPREDMYLLFAVADLDAADLGPFWLVPSEAYAELALRMSGGTLRISASMKPASRDKWSPYRVERPDLPERILSLVGEMA